MSRFERMVNMLVSYEFWQSGCTYAQIAKKVDRTPRTVRRWVGIVKEGLRRARSYP